MAVNSGLPHPMSYMHTITRHAVSEISIPTNTVLVEKHYLPIELYRELYLTNSSTHVITPTNMHNHVGMENTPVPNQVETNNTSVSVSVNASASESAGTNTHSSGVQMAPTTVQPPSAQQQNPTNQMSAQNIFIELQNIMSRVGLTPANIFQTNSSVIDTANNAVSASVILTVGTANIDSLISNGNLSLIATPSAGMPFMRPPNNDDIESYLAHTGGEQDDSSENEQILTISELNEITLLDLYENIEKREKEFKKTADNEAVSDTAGHAECCPICGLEFLAKQICRQLNSCHHIFHSHCIDTWLGEHNTCPLCRHDLTGDTTSLTVSQYSN